MSCSRPEALFETNETETRSRESLIKCFSYQFNDYEKTFFRNKSLRKIDVCPKYRGQLVLEIKRKKCFTIFHGGEYNLIFFEGCWQLILNLTFLNLQKWNGFFMCLIFAVYFRENCFT